MAGDRRTNHRQKLRDQGFRPLEVWLPTDMIEQIDSMKDTGQGRDAVIGKLLAATLNSARTAGNPNQLQLAL